MRLLAEVEKYTNRKEFISSSKGNDNKQNNEQLLYLHNHGQKSALNKKEYPKPKIKGTISRVFMGRQYVNMKK